MKELMGENIPANADRKTIHLLSQIVKTVNAGSSVVVGEGSEVCLSSIAGSRGGCDSSR